MQETDCTGGMTHTEWCNPCLTADDRLHPTTFTADMVSQESMARMREDLLKGLQRECRRGAGGRQLCQLCPAGRRAGVRAAAAPQVTPQRI